MTSSAREEPRPLPQWLRIGISVVLVGHFVAIASVVLNATSGPWMQGAPPTPGPQFAAPIETLSSPYLVALRMTHTYHFPVDRPKPSVYLEVNLQDANGKHLKTVKLPDPKAFYWIRHRQQLLADGLFMDNPLPPPQGERLTPGKKKTPMVTIWSPVENAPNKMALRTVAEHLVPRDGPVNTPSDWSMILVKAYARHLCQTHGAASAEILRHSRDIVLPPTLLGAAMPGQERPEPPPMLFDELIYNFGVHRRD